MRRGASAAAQSAEQGTGATSSEPKPQPRIRHADIRNAPRSVGQEVSRYMALDSNVSVARLQERIASDVAVKKERDKQGGAPAAPLARGESVKYPVALPIDLGRDRAAQTLKEDLKDDPSGDPLNRMLSRTLDRRDQRNALARRLQPSVPTIGDVKQPWEYQLMMAQRYADDGEGISNDFFAVLDSKAIVSDALHQHHSTAEIRQAVTYKFNDWVETVTNEQPDTNHAVTERLNEVQREGVAALDSQRVVEETFGAFTQVLDQLHVVGHDLEHVSQRAAWAEQNRLARQKDTTFAKTRHMATLTDVSFRIDLVDPTGDYDESDDGGLDASHATSPRGGRIGDDEHNRQLAALERKLRQRYDAMMQVLKTATAERRFHRIAEQQLRQTAEDRAKEIIRLRSLFKGLVNNRGFTAAWDLAREEGYDKPNSAAAAALEAAMEGDDNPVVVHDVLRSVVEEVMQEFKETCGNGFVFSGTSGGAGGGSSLPADDNFGIVLEDEAAPDAELFREMNDMRKKQSELLAQIESMQSDGAHREDLYQRLNKKHVALTQEHQETTQLLEATEEDRNNKGTRLVELEKTVRELSAKVASFERIKAEEIAEVEQRHATDKALLERRIQDLEKEVQALQGKSGAANDEEESVDVKCKKALAKVQELEVQQRTVRGLNSALEAKMNDMKAEAHQLVAHVVTFMEPFASHMAQARAHIQGATSLRTLEAMRAMLWTDTETIVSDVRNLLIKPCMRHSADALFPTTLESLDTMTTVDLTEVEEDKGTRGLEKELQKAMQANRELKTKLQRYEGELSHLRNNKSQVVDSVRSAMSRLAEEADQAADEALDIGEMPLVSDDEHTNEENDALGADQSRRQSRGTDVGDAPHDCHQSQRTVSFRAGRSFRRPSLTGMGHRRDPDASAGSEHGCGSATPIDHGRSAVLTDDPAVETVARRASDGGLSEGSVSHRGDGSNGGASEPLRRQRSVLFEGARRMQCLGTSASSSVALDRSRSMGHRSPTKGDGDAPPEPSSPSPISPLSRRDAGDSVRRNSSARRRSSILADSPATSVLREERSGSFVGRIFQDEGTTEALDSAFAQMRARFDAALSERDAALHRAACLASDVQNQLVATADSSSRVLEGVVNNARATCFALRELSGHYAASILCPIAANHDRLWVSKEAEGLILEAKHIPRRCVAHIRRLVQLASRHHVRMANDNAVFDRLRREVLNVGDVAIAALWRRKMLHVEQRHAEAVANELSALAALHSHRVTLLTRISMLVEMPSRSPPPTATLASRRQSSSQLGTPRSGTPPPRSPPPAELRGGDASQGDEAAGSADASAVWQPPPVECVDASCTTADPSCPPSLRLVSRAQLDAVVDRIGGVVETFCASSNLGAHRATLERLTAEVDAPMDGVDACGLEGFDDEADAVRIKVRALVSALGATLGAFQQRIESESYLRFIAPPAAPAEDAPSNDPTAALTEMLSALDGDDNEGAPAVLEDAPTEVATTASEKYVALEMKHKTLEGTLRDTKQSLRKLLHNVAADRFVHIDTKWCVGDTLRRQQRHATSTPLPCPCPACGKIMVTSPQKQLVPGARANAHAHASTETDDGVFAVMAEDAYTLLRDDAGGVEWPHPATAAGAPAGGRPLPASLVAAEVRRLQQEARQHHQQQGGGSTAQGRGTPPAESSGASGGDVSFVPMGRQQEDTGRRVVSPLTWTLAPPHVSSLPDTDGNDGAIDARTPPPTLRSHDGVPDDNVGVPLLHFQSPPRVSCVDQRTQTADDLLAPLLLAMLNRLHAQQNADGSEHNDVLPTPTVGPLAVLGESTVSSFDPRRSTDHTQPPAQLSAVRERLRHFSSTMRSSIAHEFTTLQAAATRSGVKASSVGHHGGAAVTGEGVDVCLPLSPAVVPEERTQTRFYHAILDHRSAPAPTTSDVTLHITSSTSTHQQSLPLEGAEAICSSGGAARTLSRALRSADVHRRLGSGGSRSAAPSPCGLLAGCKKEGGGDASVAGLGVVGSRPPSALNSGSAGNHNATSGSGAPLAHLRHARQGSARRVGGSSHLKVDRLPGDEDASVEGRTAATNTTIPTIYRKE